MVKRLFTISLPDTLLFLTVTRAESFTVVEFSEMSSPSFIATIVAHLCFPFFLTLSFTAETDLSSSMECLRLRTCLFDLTFFCNTMPLPAIFVTISVFVHAIFPSPSSLYYFQNTVIVTFI
ncbi:hypothetical protein V8G54_001691 [Vigna mungo]|uniref:Uncharacterized protein n=1 Tax=Vigna mungo TaxID=3915 RepID=A0AAQ3SA51_VIGMU